MVIAIMVVLVMLAMGLGTFTFVEGQQRASADERVKDSAYNLAEAGLESAVAYLGAQALTSAAPWGHKTAQSSGTAGTCGPAAISTDICPDPSSVTSSFTSTAADGSYNQPDYAGAPVWTTTVRDNSLPSGACASLNLSGSCFYRESTTGTTAEYDANGDGAVWVRSQATVRGRTRILVALVKPQAVPMPYPRLAISAYDVLVDNTLNQKVIDTQGTAATPGLVGLNCINSVNPPRGNACPGADLSKGQIQPATVATAQIEHNCITEGGASMAPLHCLSANQGADMIALRKRAQAAGTYYTTCPASLTGKVVFIEYSDVCNYASGSNTWNSAASPGMVVLSKGYCCGSSGSISIGGANKYYGLIYDANEVMDNWNPTRVWIFGTAQVFGAIVSDYDGGVYIQSTAIPALTYDPNAFGQLYTDGTIKIAPGTFREVPPGS